MCQNRGPLQGVFLFLGYTIPMAMILILKTLPNKRSAIEIHTCVDPSPLALKTVGNFREFLVLDTPFWCDRESGNEPCGFGPPSVGWFKGHQQLDGLNLGGPEPFGHAPHLSLSRLSSFASNRFRSKAPQSSRASQQRWRS